MAPHFEGVHTSYAVVGVSAAAALALAAPDLVDKIRIVDKRPCNLKCNKAFVQNLFHSFFGHHPANIYQRNAQLVAEALCIFEEIRLLVRNGRNQLPSGNAQTCLEPPEFLHVHIVGEGLEGHCPAHNLHRSLADKSRGEHEGVNAQTLKFLCHLEALGLLHSAFESVVHVHLDDDSHIVSGNLHYLVDYQAHKAHSVIQAPAKFVLPPVGVRGEELADEVAVAGVDFDTVESCLAGELHGVSEILDYGEDLVLLEGSGKGRGVEVQSAGGPDRGASAGRAVSHIAAVAELYGCLGAFGVYGVGELPKFRDYLLAHPELPVEREPAAADGGIGYRGHTYASARNGGVVVKQVLRRTVVVCHILKSCRADDSVAQRYRPYLAGRKYL